MSWLRIEDRFGDHPKMTALTDRQFRVHVRAMCYSAAHRLDGLVPRGSLASLGGRPVDALACVKAGVWEPVPDGWLIHDYLVYNPSKVDQDAADADRTERARHAARARWDASSNAASMPDALLEAVPNECLSDAPIPSLKEPHTPLRGACSKSDKPHPNCRGCGTNLRSVRAERRRDLDRSKCPEHLLRLPCSSCAADEKATGA